MPRKESELVPEGNGPVHQREEFGSGQPTLEDVYQKMKESFDRWDKTLNEISVEMRERLTRLEHGARQPRLATEADGQQADTKTCERTEGAATAVQAMRGDCFSARRVEPSLTTNSTSFGMKVEPPTFPYRDDVVVESGLAAPKSCLPFKEMRSPSAAGGLLPTGKTFSATGTNFPPQLLPRSFRETSEEKKISTTRQTFAKYNRSRHPKVIETKSRQNMIFDPGGLSGCPCVCPFWEGHARCIVGGLIREAFAIRYNYLCFSRFQYAKIFPRVI